MLMDQLTTEVNSEYKGALAKRLWLSPAFGIALLVGLFSIDTGALLSCLHFISRDGSFYVSHGFYKRPFIGKLGYHLDSISSWLEPRLSSSVVRRAFPSGFSVAGHVTVGKHSLLRYDRIIDAAAREHALDPNLIKAIIAVESKFNSKAVSGAGASGLMQLMPRTAEYLGVRDIFDPEQNVNGGSKYLRFLLKKFDGDMHQALAAYNAGPKAVSMHNGIPPYPETQRYVSKVVATYEALRRANSV